MPCTRGDPPYWTPVLNNPHWPFSPKRTPFFYGWVIVAASTIGVAASIPGQTMGVSVFTDSLIEATGLSRLSLANAYLFGTLASGLLLPFGGGALDRLGARRTALLAAFGLAGTLLYLSNVPNLGAGNPWLMMPLMILGFFTLRFSGQGMLTMVSRTMLGRWFDRRRGLAAGISGLFVSFAFGGAPLLFSGWIELSGWQGAWREMAVVVAIVVGGLILLLFRNDPESCGLEMDGETPGSGPQGKLDDERSFTREQALRTPAFWSVTFALSAQSLIVTAITFHITDIGETVGLDHQETVKLFLPVAVASTGVGLLGGWLGDRVPVKALLIAMMVGQAMAIFSIPRLDSLYWPAVLGMGLSGGLFSPIATIAYPRFFGRLHLGAIVGVEMMCLVIGSAIGPSLLAFSNAEFGGYAPVLNVALVVPAAAAAFAALAANTPEN